MSDRSYGPSTAPSGVMRCPPSILTLPSANAATVSAMSGSSRFAPSSRIFLNRGSLSPSSALISSRVLDSSFLLMSFQRSSYPSPRIGNPQYVIAAPRSHSSVQRCIIAP